MLTVRRAPPITRGAAGAAGAAAAFVPVGSNAFAMTLHRHLEVKHPVQHAVHHPVHCDWLVLGGQLSTGSQEGRSRTSLHEL